MKQYSAFSNQHSARNLTIIVMVVLSLFSATAFAFTADILEQDLQLKYKDKIAMLRNFYCGDKLHFDAQGNLLSGGSTGPWTLCRDIRIKDVKVKDGKVTLKGERIYLSYDYRQKRFRNASEVWQQKKHEHKGDKVSIEIALQPNPEEALAQDAVSRLFYSSQEEFSKTMPRLWRGCLAGNLDQQTKSVSKAEPAHNSSESFIQEDHSNQSGQSSQPVASNSGGILHVGKGVTAPQPIFTPDPDYSDAARSVLFQGTVVLSAIISPDGQVQNPALVRCAGLGLDERSIEKVLSWKFKPATKDGKPVAVEVSVEVSFRLY